MTKFEFLFKKTLNGQQFVFDRFPLMASEEIQSVLNVSRSQSFKLKNTPELLSFYDQLLILKYLSGPFAEHQEYWQAVLSINDYILSNGAIDISHFNKAINKPGRYVQRRLLKPELWIHAELIELLSWVMKINRTPLELMSPVK